MVKGLALKVLEILLFSRIQLQSHDFDAAAVYNMAGKLMRGTVQMPANAAMKEMVESPVVEGDEGIRRDAPKAVVDALRCWKEWSQEPLSQAEFDNGLTLDEVPNVDVALATTNFATVTARKTRERLQVKPRVVHLANFGHVFSIARGD